MFAQAASETQAAYDVRSNLEKAEAELAAGNTPAAESLISQAENSMGPVRDSDTRSHMDEWIGRLRADTGTTVRSGTSATSPNGGNVDTSQARTSEPQQPTDPLTSQTKPETTSPQTTPPETSQTPTTTTKPPTTTTTTTTAANDGPSSSWPPSS